MTVPVMELEVGGGVYASQLPLPSSVNAASGLLSLCEKVIDKGGRWGRAWPPADTRERVRGLEYGAFE